MKTIRDEPRSPLQGLGLPRREVEKALEEKYIITVYNQTEAENLAKRLVGESRKFVCTPLPNDEWEFRWND